MARSPVSLQTTSLRSLLGLGVGVGVCVGVLLLVSPCACGAQLPSQAAAAPSDPDSAEVAGTVVSVDGALISGATVSLLSDVPSHNRQTSTDTNGRFLLAHMPTGNYTLRVTLPGFTTGTQTVTLAPQQVLQLAPVALSMATVNVMVNAVTPEQLSLEQMHAEVQQRLLGVLPNFFVSYNWTAPPLTTKQKYTLATHNVADPGNLALVGVTAGVQQAADAFPGYRQGAAGYGKRYGADLANLVVGSYMGGAVLPSLFRQDPRYYYKGTGTKRSRFVYAVTRAVVTRGDNGHAQPNVSGVLGDLSAAALSNLYYPASDREGASLFFTNGVLALAGDAMNGVVQEFFFHRITTKGKRSNSSENTALADSR